MDYSIGTWVDGTPLLVVALLILALMVIAAAAGALLRRKFRHATSSTEDSQETYVVSSVLGLVALLMGFTFVLAVDRFDTRRNLVLEEANAIGTAFLRSQLLEEPHRERLSGLLTDYIDNRIAMGEPGGETPERLKTSDGILVELWAATAAAFDDVKTIDFSTALLESMNAVIDLDTARKTAHDARVPAEVFGVLIVLVLVSSGVLGFVLIGPGRQAIGILLLLLLALVLTLMLDIDRPSAGLVNEPQQPLYLTRASISAETAAMYDKWRSP
jgi:hypothetical protein